MYDVIIVGAGPAGISASLYAKRAGLNVLVLYYGESNLTKAHKIDNYYGFENGISGEDLYSIGIKQAQNLDIELKNEEVVNIEQSPEGFIITSSIKKYECKSLIIASGNKKIRPNIKGIISLEGKGISYCAICDGFFHRNKNVAVIGNGKFAIHEANDLKNIASSITILTNGLDMDEQSEFDINSKKIKQILGDTKVESIEFDDGTTMDIDGIFIAYGEAGSSSFAKKLGIMQSKDSIITDENMQTNIKGLFSCGDSTGGVLQVSKAVYEGAIAGLNAAEYIKSIK